MTTKHPINRPTNRPRHRRPFVLATYLVFAVACALALDDSQPVGSRLEMTKFLASMAATLFAILGIWIAVLDPKEILTRSVAKELAPHQQLAMCLMVPWITATVTFAAAVALSWLFGTLTPSINEQPSARLLFAMAAANAILTLLILDILLGTLMPIAKIRQELKIQQRRKQSRE